MGLDMYLRKRWTIREGSDEPGRAELIPPSQVAGFTPHDERYLIEQMAHWRKANAIHKWFVEHVQDGEDDCRAYPVTVTQLQELLTTVETVLEHPQLAEQLLPTQAGCFFGSTDYNTGYVADLQQTVTILRWALSEADEAEFEYQASW